MTITKLKPAFLEFAKWILVIWLLFPITMVQEKVISFPRIMAGIMLFVVFSGKMFYDIMLKKRNRDNERSNAADLLAMIGMVVVISTIVGLFIVMIGFLVVSGMQQATAPQE
jgi:hypothetical protein